MSLDGDDDAHDGNDVDDDDDADDDKDDEVDDDKAIKKQSPIYESGWSY